MNRIFSKSMSIKIMHDYKQCINCLVCWSNLSVCMYRGLHEVFATRNCCPKTESTVLVLTFDSIMFIISCDCFCWMQAKFLRFCGLLTCLLQVPHLSRQHFIDFGNLFPARYSILEYLWVLSNRNSRILCSLHVF